MTTSVAIGYKQLLESLLEAFNDHLLGNDKKALTIINKPSLKKATDKDDFLRHFREGLQNFFQGMSLRFENIEYARHKAISSLTHFNSALESMFEASYSHPPEELEEQVIVQIYKLVLFELERDKKSQANGSAQQDIKKIKQALKNWNHQAPVKANQEETFRFLLLLFAKSVAHITILVKLEPWPKEIQKKRGWREPKVKDELERLLNTFTFVHLIAKNSHKLPVVVRREVSRLFGALGYFYRGKVFFLLSDYERENFRRAFNDFESAENIVIAEVQDLAEKRKKDLLEICWKWLSASVHFAKGYLYQRAFAHNQAFENFAAGMASYIKDFESSKKNFDYKSLTIAENEVAQGKIFIEMGEFKNALKQFLKALDRIFIISSTKSNPELEKNLQEIRKAQAVLEGARQEEIFQKKVFYDALFKFNPKVLEDNAFKSLRLLVSDICARIAFVLFILFYKSEDPEKFHHLKAEEWLEVALRLDPSNGLAQFNRLLSGAKKKISSNQLNFRNDSSIRRFLTLALETLVNSPNHEDLEEERSFFKQSITYSDSLIKKPLEINYYLTPEKKEKKDGMLVLKRWSSSSPRVPRPTTFQMRGGGYMVFWNNRGIAIDPGFDFITNLYAEGYSISDIDAIIVTHDHIDHTDDFDAILALNYQLNRYNESTYLKPKAPINLSLFLNTGFMEKYTPYLSLNTKEKPGVHTSGDGYIDHIYTLAPHSTIDMTDTPFQFKIEVIPARHREITLDKYAVGFKLHLYDKNENEKLTLGFTSDTAYYEALGNKFKDCDIVIPHVGFVTFRELGQLLELQIDKIIKAASHNYFSDIEEELRFFSALGFRDVKNWDDLSAKWGAGGEAQHRGFLRQHLGYSGVKKIWEKMCESEVENQLMVISELHEEMGSFRNKLASAFNHKARNLKNAPMCFTGDTGMHLLFEQGAALKPHPQIKCISCAKDNDLAPEEIFHHPENVREVCIKGEKEGIFYFCKEHAPDPDTEFREKIERFNLFG